MSSNRHSAGGEESPELRRLHWMTTQKLKHCQFQTGSGLGNVTTRVISMPKAKLNHKVSRLHILWDISQYRAKRVRDYVGLHRESQTHAELFGRVVPIFWDSLKKNIAAECKTSQVSRASAELGKFDATNIIVQFDAASPKKAALGFLQSPLRRRNRPPATSNHQHCLENICKAGQTSYRTAKNCSARQLKRLSSLSTEQ